MLTRIAGRLSYANVVATLALFAALAGGAVAATGGFVGSDGKIHGCVTTAGQLTLIKPGHTCRHGVAIAWNQKGRRGPRGPRGATGTVDTTNFYNKAQSDSRFLPIGGTAANASSLGGLPSSAFLPAASVGRIDWQPSCGTSNGEPLCPSMADVLNLGGLTLHAQCTQPSPGHAELKLTGSGGNESETNVGYTTGSSAAQGGYGGPGGTVFDFTSTGADGQVGTIVYRDPGGTTVTVSFFAYEVEGEPSIGDATCELYGNAQETNG